MKSDIIACPLRKTLLHTFPVRNEKFKRFPVPQCRNSGVERDESHAVYARCSRRGGELLTGGELCR